MDNGFITSTVSLRTSGSLSFSFSDYIYYSDERFGRYPYAYSSHLLSRTCCTCLSNSVYKVPISPICNCNKYGLRQSTLIQRLPHKKMIFGGFDRCYDTPVPVCDVDRSCCCNKVCHIRGRSVGGRRGGLRKCMVSEEGSKRCSFGGDEAEVLLSLLTDELGEECSDVRKENRRLIKKIVVEKKGNGETINRCKSKMKRVDLGVPKSESKFECESVVFRSRKEDKRRREEMIRTEKDREDLQRKENLKVQKKEEDREALLRKESGNARANEEERETLLRKEIWKVRAREEERDDLLRREEHRERMRRDGSSCSSYYSLSSTGEYYSDTEIEGTGEDLGVELSNMYEKDSKRSDKIVSDEVGKEDYGVGMRKKRTEIGSYAGSNGAESYFRKKSEKKPTDVLIEETESRKGALQKDSSLLEVNESGYGTSGIKFDEERRQLWRQTGNEVRGQSETRIKYKQFMEMPESPNDEVVTSYGSQKLYSGREEKSAKVTSLSSEAKREHQTMVGLGTKEDEYSRNTCKVSEASKVKKIDARKTSISPRLSETRMKKEDGCSTDVITSNDDAEKKQQSDQVIKDERRKSQQLTKKGSSSISQMQSDSRIIKQEENVNLTYGSYTESKEQQFQTHAESFGRTEVRIGAKQMTNETVTHTGGLIGAKDGNKTRSETLVTPPSSQLAAIDESHVESMSGLAIEEVTDASLEGGSTALHKHVLGSSPALHHEKYGGAKKDEANEQPSMFIANEDAIGLAEQLQKSSAHNVVRHEISTSEIQEEKKTYESKFVCEEQSNRKGSSQYVSLESESEEHHSRLPSRGSKTKGPSDETWEIDEPSVQEHSKIEVQDDARKAENAIIKRSGRSLWNIIGDIVRLKWSTRSESHSTGGKAGGISPNQSTSSDAWFSGHEAEEDEGVSGRKEKRLTQEPASIHQKQKKTSTPSKEDSSSTSTVEAYAKHVGVDTLSSSTVLESGSASMTISLPSSEETSKSNFEGSSSGAPVSESLIPLPAMRLRRSPIVKEISEAAEAGSSGSDTSGQPVSTGLMEKSSPDVNDKLKQRKLQRKDQILKDRFDEWEEAYRVEAEQRKIDEVFMREALLEAKKAADNWEVPVGAVLVQGGKIISRGCNLVEELRDSTAHAEMICIREASNVLRTWRLSETTLYVTLEPCPMCAGAILQARIDTVVWGAPNKLLGADGSWIKLFPSGDVGNGLEQMDKPAAPVHPFHPKITIRRGVLASECADAMQRFFQLRRREKEKKSDPPPPPSCLPISHRPTKFFTKMHDAFNIMFCL